MINQNLLKKNVQRKMKKPEFLKKIHIGKIISTVMKQRNLTIIILAERIGTTKCSVNRMLKQKSLKINRIIEVSYALGENLLHYYLNEMPLLMNTETNDDEIIIKIKKDNVVVTPSKKIRTTEFLQFIHIGKILKEESKKQKVSETTLSNIIYRTQSTVSRIFKDSDIDIERLILSSYYLNYDFIRNIYLPFMAVDTNKMIANDIIFEGCTIKVNPKKVSIITERQTVTYH